MEVIRMNKIKRMHGTIINSNGLCINNNNHSLEKTADEMFLELGYEKNVDTSTNFIYQNKKNNKEIRFYKIYKCVEISLIEFEEFEGNSIFSTMQELQAINKKCQELGWI